MALTKQAKILTSRQIEVVYSSLVSTRRPARNRLIFLLSVRAGLRAKEISSLKWAMVTDAEGNLSSVIRLPDFASKGRSGRVIPMSRDLRSAFSLVKSEATKMARQSPYVVTTERSHKTSSFAVVNMFADWYRHLNFDGASSHSGRRTAITNWARKISTVGGSLRDVQLLAGHSALCTTQRYIESDALAQHKVVEL